MSDVKIIKVDNFYPTEKLQELNRISFAIDEIISEKILTHNGKRLSDAEYEAIIKKLLL